MNFKRRERYRRELFIDPDLRVGGMINSNQLDLIKIGCFPEFLRNLQNVVAILLFQPIADQDIVFSRFRGGNCTYRRNHPQRTFPK